LRLKKTVQFSPGPGKYQNQTGTQQDVVRNSAGRRQELSRTSSGTQHDVGRNSAGRRQEFSRTSTGIQQDVGRNSEGRRGGTQKDVGRNSPENLAFLITIRQNPP